MQNKLDVVILTGRPASGKSEVIAYLKSLTRAERLRRFGLGEVEELDDFPYVWECFEIDDILEKHGQERLLTTPDYYFKSEFAWTLLIERMNLEYRKRLARDPYYFQHKTLLVEFSRGGPTGMRDAFAHLAPELLKKAGVVYIDVSFEESLRKNRLRARAGQQDSILYHSLPDEKMKFYYQTNDWEELSQGDPKFLSVQSIQVPYAVFKNEPDQTGDLKRLEPALEAIFSKIRNAHANFQGQR
ncbi:MAG: hypothetical protein ACXWP5_10170 [Bdellovibrionota bacterium]